MMLRTLWRFAALLILMTATLSPASAREGDTLLPIEIEAPEVQMWPEELISDQPIESRVAEARNSGAPVAVRIVDLTQPDMEIPFQIRQFVRESSGQPLSDERLQAMAESWAAAEAIETSEGANDGFLLLVVVPEDHTLTQAVWWIGPNALPLNGLTQENILATHSIMDTYFAAGDVSNGIYLGLSEFSYNIQFGVPARLERSELRNALHWSTIPMAIASAAAGLAIPILAFVYSRRNNNTEASAIALSPWDAAALHLGRARPSIPAAMLLDSFHDGEITPLANGGLRIEPDAKNPATVTLRAFADADGVVPPAAMYEIEAILVPVRDEIEVRLTSAGAMTESRNDDRQTMLIVMGVATAIALISVIPTVVSMSAIGVFGILVAVIGDGFGWWWLAYRSYTSPAGESLLQDWLETATSAETSAWQLAVHQQLLTDTDGGPQVTDQIRLMRQLRGLSAG